MSSILNKFNAKKSEVAKMTLSSCVVYLGNCTDIENVSVEYLKDLFKQIEGFKESFKEIYSQTQSQDIELGGVMTYNEIVAIAKVLLADDLAKKDKGRAELYLNKHKSIDSFLQKMLMCELY